MRSEQFVTISKDVLLYYKLVLRICKLFCLKNVNNNF